MEKFISSPVFLATTFPIILVIIALIIFRNQSKSTTNLPPGPWKLPIIGNLHQLTGDHPHRRLKQLAQKYGPDVMILQLGELPHLVISSPEAAKQVMKTHDLAFASRPSMLAVNILYDGCKDIAMAPYGEYWRQMRKICVLELLSNKRVLSFRRIREHEVSNLIQLIRSRKTGESSSPVNLSKMVEQLNSSVISRAAFGKEAELDDEFMAVLDEIFVITSSFRVSDLYPSVKFLPYLTGFRAKLEKMHKASDSILEKIINEHKSRRGLRVGKDHVDEDEDLVDVLLNHQESQDLGVPITMEAVKAVTLELFLAGLETSSTAIEWAVTEMIRHPRVMNLAQKEVRQAFSDKGDVEEATLHQLNYLDMVIAETLRLHPPIPLLVPRQTRDKAVLNGCNIPIGTNVIVNAWAINRDARHWTDAEKFFPERFVGCSKDYKGNHFDFIPFGAGRRMCPGISFGLAIVKLTLASLLFHFDWTLPGNMKPESLDMKEVFGISLTRKNPLLLVPLPRNTMP